MNFFSQPKPRRFHHEPVYYDEHRDRVRKIQEQAQKEIGAQSSNGYNPDDIRGSFTSHVREQRRKRAKGFLGLTAANSGAIFIIILILLLVWVYLSR